MVNPLGRTAMSIIMMYFHSLSLAAPFSSPSDIIPAIVVVDLEYLLSRIATLPTYALSDSPAAAGD